MFGIPLGFICFHSSSFVFIDSFEYLLEDIQHYCIFSMGRSECLATGGFPCVV